MVRYVVPMKDLNRNGLSYNNVGSTYHADHAQANRNMAESALDLTSL